jgi:hypothetical protein
MLNTTPQDRMVDPQGRPYFLWDTDMPLSVFRERLHGSDIEVRAYLVGKLMRQAKPDDVFAFVSLAEIAELWPRLERYLGKSRPFWTWLLGWWKARGERRVEVDLGGARIWVDTPHQILVNKLCALLSRSELRDLEDVQALVGSGLDLQRALADAPSQDGGFSPLTFAWVLRQLPIAAMATALGGTEASVPALERYRDDLVEQVLAQAVPE